METPQVSETVKLSDEEIGRIHRRVSEIIRRVEGGSIKFPWVAGELQRVIEGKVLPEIAYRAQAEPLVFERLPENKRGHSKAPWSKRLSHSLQRLEYPTRNTEHVMAEMWEAECLPDPSLNYGRTPINAIMGDLEPTHRDIQVIASTLQWLGTNIGSGFLTRYIRVSQMRIV